MLLLLAYNPIPSSPTMNSLPNSAELLNQERTANRAVVEAFFAALEAKDLDRFLAVWADTGRQVMPFAPAGFPQELVGKAAISQQYGSLPENYVSMQFPRTIHDGANPEHFFVEYRGEIVVKATGKPYNNTYIGVFQVQNGQIVQFTEYFNPIVLNEAFGQDLQKNFNTTK